MTPPSLRHSLLLTFSFIFALLSFFAFFGWRSMADWGGIFFLLAIMFTVFLALISQQKWLAVFWPFLFILFGMVVHHDFLLFADIITGIAFSVLFLLVQRESRNFLTFSFFFTVKPALRLFLLTFFLAFAVGIYTGVPSEKIEEKMEQGIASLGKIPLPGGTEFTDFITNLLRKSRKSMFAQEIFGNMLEQKIATECNGDQICAEAIRKQLEQEVPPETTAQFPTPLFSPEQVTAGTKSFLQEQLDTLTQKLNLSLLTAAAFLLVLLPFSGIFAFFLTFLIQPFFFLAKKSGIIRTQKRTIEQNIFV